MHPDRETGFERELRELGERIEYPPTPDLARAVRRQLDDEAPIPDEPRTFWSRLPNLRWAAAAAALVLIFAVPSLSPELRAALTGIFETGDSPAERGQAVGGGAPEPSPAESAIDTPEAGDEADAGRRRPLGEGLGLGERVSTGEKRASKSGHGLLVPARPELGDPDEIFYSSGPARRSVVTLVYEAGPHLPPLGATNVGLLLAETPGTVGSAYLPGGAPGGPELERVAVAGGRGYWVPAGHPSSSAVGGTVGPGANVLLWEREGLALRLEANLPKREMVRIAESVRRR